MRMVLVAALVMAVPHAVRAEAPASITCDGTNLVLNGAGVRTKYFMQMYMGGLYLEQPSRDAAGIIAADAPMAIRLDITSAMVTKERMDESLREGFQNATGGQVAPIAREIEQFRQCFAQPIAKGDVFEFVYRPARGVTVVKNGRPIGVIQGLAFKQAMFGIWLCERPADAGLRVAMLGK
jgi:hypothetical protein